MSENEKQTEKGTESIDYNDSQANIDKAKAKARDEDAERLRKESE
jgi:hypothetical protein